MTCQYNYVLVLSVVDISFDKAVYEAKESSGFVVLSLIRAGAALIPVSVTVVPNSINATAIGKCLCYKSDIKDV